MTEIPDKIVAKAHTPAHDDLVAALIDAQNILMAMLKQGVSRARIEIKIAEITAAIARARGDTP